MANAAGMKTEIRVEVWTDGVEPKYGGPNYQARCTGCGYVGKWRLRESVAVGDAEAHSKTHA